MSGKFRLIFTLFVAVLLAHSGRAVSVGRPKVAFDSVGVERRDGRTFVLHRVEAGQTLYALLRKYRISMADFKAANPGVSEAVQFEQIVRIPYGSSGSTAQAVAVPISSSEPALPGAPEVRPATYAVQAGETLYGIARRFGLSVADLTSWNGLSETGGVQVGQTLVLSAPAARPDSARRLVAAEPDRPVSPNRKPDPEPTTSSVPQPVVPKVAEARSEPARQPVPNVPAPEVRRTADGPVPNAGAGLKRHTETGLAELIEGAGRSGKYLALHRTAPVGTVLTVRNEANDQTILVKVIGKLPDTGLADRVIVRLSPRAFAQLAPSDKRFRAEVSYFAE